MQTEKYPLPFGWVKDYDQGVRRHFYVDTKADPPRSIWIHPYEDEQYLDEHPDVREKLGTTHSGDLGSDPPPSFEESQRASGSRPSHSNQSAFTGPSKRARGPIGTLKDQLFGTKEERQAERRLRKEEERARREAQQQYYYQMELARQQHYANQPQGYYGPGGYGGAPCDGGFGYNQNQNRRGPGGLALPLIGGLVGGLLLGEAFDGF